MAPVDGGRAGKMIDSLCIRPLLDGKRGAPPADLASLTGAVIALSAIAEDLGDLIAEMDVNPLIVSDKGAVAVDALIIPRKTSS